MGAAQEVAVISGAGRGIGAATARELGRRGYHVIVNYLRDADSAAAVVADTRAAGGTAQAAQADVCDAEQATALVEAVIAEHGHLDVLVCNANTVAPPFGPLAAVAWEAFAAKVTGELAGAYFLTQRALAAMREQRSGRIVHVSATLADTVGGTIAHSTAKAALNAFSRQVAAEAAQYGVTVNTVAPGAVNTDATAGMFTDSIRQYFSDRSVRGRLMGPEDIGRVIGLLLDDAFTVVTGQLIRIDAGFDLLSQQLDGLAAQLALSVNPR